VEKLIGLLIVGLIMLVKYLVNAALEGLSGGRSQTQANPARSEGRPASQQRPTESEEERMRRFMEALGLPGGSATPPPVKPRPAVNRPQSPNPVRPPLAGRGTISKRELKRRELTRAEQERRVRSSASEDQPPILTARRDLFKDQAGVTQQEAEFSIQRADQAISSAESQVENLDVLTGGSQNQKAEPIGRNAVRELLRKRESIRSAFVLKEILGPPKALERGW
jgi:hypothetical protein